MITIELLDLPKLSLNKWYAGTHWTKRKAMKDIYRVLVGSQTKHKQTKPCEVTYHFYFKSRPLDPSNCIAMVKLVEDCIFPDDSYKIVRRLTLYVSKSEKDKVVVKIRNS